MSSLAATRWTTPDPFRIFHYRSPCHFGVRPVRLSFPPVPSCGGGRLGALHQ